MALNHNRQKNTNASSEPAVVVEPAGLKPITPTEELFMEALSARIRTGENLWTFDSRFTRTAKALEERGLVTWKSGVVENSIMVFLTAVGKAVWLSETYKSPVEQELDQYREKLQTMGADLEELQSQVRAETSARELDERNARWERAREAMLEQVWSLEEGGTFGYAELIHNVSVGAEVDVTLAKLVFEFLEARGEIISTEKGFIAGHGRPAPVKDEVAAKVKKTKPSKKKAGKSGAKKALKKAKRLVKQAEAELKSKVKKGKR